MSSRRLNYHHLLYFHTVARTGAITEAAEELGLAQPTVSAQLRQFERNLGHQLLKRAGRGLELTETGRVVHRYANDIFALGDEMVQVLDGRPADGRPRLRVGIADVLPKMAVARVLEPLQSGQEAVHLLCYEGKPGELLSKLSVHELDIVLSDSPVGPDQNIRAFNHLLGECSLTIFAPRGSAAQYRREFPQALDGARFVAPTENTSMRRMLDYWFARQDIQPLIIAEIEDSALVKAFAQQQGGLFAAPTLVRDQVAALYEADPVGEIRRFKSASTPSRSSEPSVIRPSRPCSSERVRVSLNLISFYLCK